MVNVNWKSNKNTYTQGNRSHSQRSAKQESEHQTLATNGVLSPKLPLGSHVMSKVMERRCWVPVFGSHPHQNGSSPDGGTLKCETVMPPVSGFWGSFNLNTGGPMPNTYAPKERNSEEPSPPLALKGSTHNTRQHGAPGSPACSSAGVRQSPSTPARIGCTAASRPSAAQRRRTRTLHPTFAASTGTAWCRKS